MDLPRTGSYMGSAVRPWAVPNLGMADWTFELWTGSNMGLTHPELGLRIWSLGPAWKI